MKKEQEHKLIEILSNSALNSLKFKDVLEWAKAETIKNVQKQVSEMKDKEKENLLENLEKQITAAKELAQKQETEKVTKAKKVEEVES